MSETIAQSQSENYNKSVGTSAVVLAKGGGTRQSGSGLITVGGSIDMPRYVTVHNNHGSQVLYLGWGSDVSTSNGLPVPAGEYRTLRVWYDDELWAIASGASTDTRVYVLHGKGTNTFDVLSLSPTLWLDASDESTITTDVGVSVWADKSGNGYDVTQATGANQPATGTRTINGLNVLDFDGSNDYLTNTAITTTQPNSIFAVAQFDVTSSYRFLLDGITSRQILYNYNGEANINAGTEVQSTSTPVSGAASIWSGTFDGASSDLRINGVSEVSGNAGTNGLTDLAVGTLHTLNNFFLNGAVAEVIIIDSALSAQQISDTETYLADKWGITLP